MSPKLQMMVIRKPVTRDQERKLGRPLTRRVIGFNNLEKYLM